MDKNEWKKLKAELEKLEPSLRIKKYSELLDEVDRDSEIFDEILSLIEKASVEESVFIEKEEKVLEELAEPEPVPETPALEDKVPESLEDEVSNVISGAYIPKQNENLSEGQYKTMTKLETHNPEVRTEEDFYKASDLIKKKKTDEEEKSGY